MENQVNQLKLNVTNINSYLISSNKQLKKLRGDKRGLFDKLKKKEKIKNKEDKLESRNVSIGSGFSKIVGAVSSPVKSIFDKILEFFGLIALGILVQKLPQIIEKINAFIDSGFFKTLVGMFDTLAKGVEFLVDLTLSITPSEIQKLDTESKNLKKNVDGLTGEAKKLEGKKGEYEKIASQLNVPMAPMAPGSMYPIKLSEPKKYSSGGTVSDSDDKQTTPSYTPRESGELKISKQNMKVGFGDYAKSVDNISETVDRDEQNLMAFAEMSKNFKEWSSSVGVTTTSPTGGFMRPPGGLRPVGPASMVSGGTKPSSAHITSGVGYRLHPIYGGRRYHTGVDVSMGLGTPVSSAQDAEVIHSGWKNDGYGYSVVLRHSDGAETRYGHFQSVNVRTGQTIKAGQLLGLEGSTGDSTGPHVHFSHYPKGGAMSYGGKGYVTEITKDDAIFMDSYFRFGGNVQALPKKPGAGGMNISNFMIKNSGNNKNLVNTSSHGGNQSLFVYAVQPVETFVPFPYPVPIETESSSPEPSKPRVPSGWRA